jgi:hypothetical protein
MGYSYEDIKHLHRGNRMKAKGVQIPELDKYIVFKKNFSVIGGISNVGKTTAWLYILFVWALKHPDNLKFALMLNENNNDEMVAQLIEWYNAKFIDDKNHSKEEIEEALKWINRKFFFMNEDVDDGQATVSSVLNKLFKTKHGLDGFKKFDFDGVFIDPYNSLFTSHYTEHYSNGTRFRKAVKALDAKIMVSMHANTEAQRSRDEDGRTKVPHITNMEMGSMWQNRADDNVVIHRQIQIEEEKYISEIHVQKIKHIRSGGQPTPHDNPITVYWREDLAGRFSFEESGDVITPQLIEQQKELEFKENE